MQTGIRLRDLDGILWQNGLGLPVLGPTGTHAAFGAIGSCGVVVEAELESVPAFHLVKTTTLVDRFRTEAGIDAVLAARDHVSRP